MTVHSSIKETPFERHYGRKPRTEIHNFLNVSPDKQYIVSAKPETQRVHSFTNGNGAYDQLVIKAPRKLREDVSNKFPYLFLERKRSRDKFENMYANKPQMAVARTKHTIITDTNKIIHRKRASKPLNPIFQNPLSRRGGRTRGHQNIKTAEQSERCSTQVLEESVLNHTLDWENTTISTVYGRGRRKLIRDRSNTPTSGTTIDARLTTEDNPNIITVVNQNEKSDLIKFENIEPNENQNEQNIRKSTRLRSTNPINRYDNPITF